MCEVALDRRDWATNRGAKIVFGVYPHGATARTGFVDELETTGIKHVQVQLGPEGGTVVGEWLPRYEEREMHDRPAGAVPEISENDIRWEHGAPLREVYSHEEHVEALRE